MKFRGTIIFYLVLITFITGCDKEPDKADFDRGAMLSNLSTNVIKVAIAESTNSIVELENLAATFIGTPNQMNLNALQNGFLSAYKKFQQAKPFNFGPFEDYGIVSALNTYPTDTSKIEANVSSGSYTLGSAENIQAVGFPALDYLLFNSPDAEIVEVFSNGVNADNRMQLLTDLVSKMKTEIQSAQNQWDVIDQDFIAADGNDVGGSTSILFNAFVMDVELLKNTKIGIPAGNQTGGATLPSYVEGFYSQNSLELAKESVAGLKYIFKGGSGIGFEEYIRDVEGEVETSLADQIIAKFDLCTNALDAIEDPLSEKVDSHNSLVQNAYTEIKTLVTFIKTDMSSALGLLITFQDNDGD